MNTAARRVFPLALAALALPCLAEEPTHPYPGVTVQHVEQAEPREQIFTAIVDLRASHAVVRTPRAGADPDGDGPATTTLQPTTAIAAREKFDLAVNGDYFVVVRPGAKDAEGQAAQQVFRTGVPSTVRGPAVTDGTTWATTRPARPALVIRRDGTAAVQEIGTPSPDVAQAIAGNVMLVVDGKPLYQDEPPENFTKGNRMRHPRTAVGVDRTGTVLYIAVIDGRSKESAGMNHKELAKAMADLGAYNAVNLDGGGSSTFALRDPKTRELKVLNAPSDHKERSVANVLGLTFPPGQK